MNEERKIVAEEVDTVAPPPRARVDMAALEGADAPTETAGEKLGRKRDYLAGFLVEKPAQVPAHAPGGDLQAAVIEALKEIYDPEIPVDIYELGLIYKVAKFGFRCKWARSKSSTRC